MMTDANIKIVQALEGHIPSVMRLISACIIAMCDNGIYQWDEIYPSDEIIARDMNKGYLYVLEQDNSCIAAVSLSDEQEEAYQQVRWLGNEPVMVIHRLCVGPTYQGKGIGSYFMNFSEEYARHNAYASIRLDAYTGNPTAVRMYERRGYRKAGQVYFPRRELPFFCFEKILSRETTGSHV
jgi:GNAT superfamily N-acetyltransferase